MSEIVVTVKLPEGVEADDVEVTVDPMPAKAEESSVGAPEPITWRGVSRIEYTHAELLDLVDTVRRNTGGDLHNIVSAFNGNTLIRLISQADRALPAPAEARSEQAEGEA